ncbi:MAG: hypothetical protein LBU65_02860 [Planctomycetaceae bacterium]|nr:hypothetical protein [Planctomycetaceae bacterium]
MKVDYVKGLEEPVASYELEDIPFLPYCLEEHRDSYHVLSTPETVDGHLCWVVERPGMDKFWIAPGLGYMLCKRRFHWGKDKPLRAEIRAKEFKEIEPGDCGHGALYVLMKLEHRNISLNDIKRHIPIDSVHGCSMESLYNASTQINFLVDVRFVPPSKITEVPCSFILHGVEILCQRCYTVLLTFVGSCLRGTLTDAELFFF